MAPATAAALPELRSAVRSSTGLAPQVELVERRGAPPPMPAVASRGRGGAPCLSSGRSRRRSAIRATARRRSSRREGASRRRGRAPCLSTEGRGGAPLSGPRRAKVVAAGKGLVAERILELAREAGVPTREDSALAQALAELELGSEVPPLLYQAVAEALVWALRLDRSLKPARRLN